MKKNVNLHEAELRDDRFNIPQTLKQNYTLVGEYERIPFLLGYLQLLEKQKVIVFVSTCDEVEFFEQLFLALVYRDKDGVMTEKKVLSQRVFKLHGNIE